jgi:exodeoxyribonuclease VII large subunit
MTSPFPPPGVTVLTVGELTRAVREKLEEAFVNVWVEGEVSNLAKPSSGHQYLTLKDDTAPLKAVLYRGVGLRLKFDLTDGMHVIARGRLMVYEPRGEYQFAIEEIQPKGVGPLELAFRQLKEKLSVRGWFEPGRKKRLPRIPRRMVLVTSATGSAVRDMLEILARRWPAVEVWVCPVRVQGEGAVPEVVAALGALNRLRPADGVPIDLLILGRGGGSLEDLWTFNEEAVAEAIVASRIPVVTGIGHEDDLTIADMVADRRCLTPSDAAARCVPDRAEVMAWLEGLEGKMRDRLQSRIETARTKLDELASRRCFRLPLERVRDEERRLDDWLGRMDRAARQRLEQARQRVEAAAARLESVSPLNVLARGYSLTRKESEKDVLRTTERVRPGDILVTQLHQGRIVSRVEEAEYEPGRGREG